MIPKEIFGIIESKVVKCTIDFEDVTLTDMCTEQSDNVVIWCQTLIWMNLDMRNFIN